MPRTTIGDLHFVNLAQIVPNLKSFTFELNLEISDIAIQALSELEKLEELFYEFNGEIVDTLDMFEVQDSFTSR